jgi:hypothetical protein
MNRGIVVLFITTWLASCHTAPHTDERTVAPATVTNSDTLIVDKPAAVLYEADSTKMEREKKKIGEGDFNTTADDYVYYLGESQAFLDSVKLPVLTTRDKKYIKFVGIDRTSEIIRLDTVPELWCIYFFHPSKHYLKTDFTETQDQYRSYFP